MNSSLLRRLLLIASATLGLALNAQTLVISPNGTGVIQYDYAGSLGTLFDVNPGFTVTVTSLGLWDEGHNGVDFGDGQVSAALFTRTGTTSGTMIPGSQIDFYDTGNSITRPGTYTGATYLGGQFYEVNLGTTIVLTPGSYAVVVWNMQNANAFVNGVLSGTPGPAANFDTLFGALTLTGAAYGAAAAFPDTIEATPGALYLAGTFSATAIPEPSTYAALFGACAIGLAAWRRHARRATVRGV